MKITKQSKGNYTVTIPKNLIAHMGWDEGTEVCFCPLEDGLKIVPLRSGQ